MYTGHDRRDGTDRRDGEDRRHELCSKEHEWGELSGSLKSMSDSLVRMEGNWKTVLDVIFNKDGGLMIQADRNKNSIRRMWWWLGTVSIAIILSALAIMVEHFKGNL